MEAIQLHQMNPAQLQTVIAAGVAKELKKVVKELQPKQPTEYMTRVEAAKFLHINLSTLHHWTRKGKLNPYGLGNRIYYKRAEIEAAIVKLDYTPPAL